MVSYANGLYPLRLFVHRGDNIYLTPSLNARWNEGKRIAKAKYGVTLYITGDIDGLGGWNAYRPILPQRRYRAHYGIMAALPGYSSHGGKYKGREVFAADVANWNDLAPGNPTLAWARFVAIMRIVGLAVDFVSPQELWHIGDFNPAWTVPTFGAVAVNPGTTQKPDPADEPELPPEEDDMPTVIKNTTKNEWSLLDPSIGTDLPRFVAGQSNKPRSEKTAKGVVNTYRGFMVTTDPDVGAAWSRTYCRFYKNVPQGRLEDDYRAAQNEASRLSIEMHRS